MTTVQSISPPPPPDGYRQAYPFRYPKLKLQVAGALLLLAVVPLLVALTWELQNLPDEVRVTIRPIDLALLLLATPLTVVVHELIHGLAIAWRLGAAYAGAFGQFQRRKDMFVVALAPLGVLTALLIPLLMVPSRPVVVTAFMMLVLNTGGAVGDLYLVWRLLRLPRASLLYDVDTQHMFIFEPDRSGR
jgi:hypothetical protein